MVDVILDSAGQKVQVNGQTKVHRFGRSTPLSSESVFTLYLQWEEERVAASLWLLEVDQQIANNGMMAMLKGSLKLFVKPYIQVKLLVCSRFAQMRAASDAIIGTWSFTVRFYMIFRGLHYQSRILAEY